jgi:hypothetical protein
MQCFDAVSTSPSGNKRIRLLMSALAFPSFPTAGDNLNEWDWVKRWRKWEQRWGRVRHTTEWMECLFRGLPLLTPAVGQGANQAIEDGVALAVFLAKRGSAEIVDVLRRYEVFRRERTDIIQAEARKQGLRLDSRSGSLQDRDREIARSAEFRKWLYDFHVESEAVAYLNNRCTSMSA